jgi:hypothetical protein
VAEVVRTNGWLIFTSHDVDDDPSRYGVSPALLALAATTAKDAGCRIVTIAEGLALAHGATQERGLEEAYPGLEAGREAAFHARRDRAPGVRT